MLHDVAMRSIAACIILLWSAGAAASPASESQRSGELSVVLPVATTVGGIAIVAAIEATGVYNGFDHPQRNVAAVGTAVGVAAIAVGPSVGHLYTGDVWNRGLQVRLASLGVMAAGFAIAETGEPLGCSFCLRTRDYPAIAMILVGGGTYVGATIYEIATGPRAVRATTGGAMSS